MHDECTTIKKINSLALALNRELICEEKKHVTKQFTFSNKTDHEDKSTDLGSFSTSASLPTKQESEQPSPTTTTIKRPKRSNASTNLFGIVH